MGLTSLRRHYDTRELTASAEPDYREIAKANERRIAELEAENAKLRATPSEEPAAVAPKPEAAEEPETAPEAPKPRRR